MTETVPERVPSLKKRLALMLILVVLVVGGIVGFNLFKLHMIQTHLAGMKNPSQSVTAQTVQTQPWEPQVRTIGSLRAVQGVDLSLEIAGVVRKLHFAAGATVKAGEPLLELVDDAEAAQLAVASTAVRLAEITLERDQAQLRIQAISRAQLDADVADLDSKRAQRDLAAAQLTKKHLLAPFAGIIGISTVNPGQFLNPGAKIVTLQRLDPLWVDFTIPQGQAAELKVGQVVTLALDGHGAAPTGKITAVNPLVENTTRNVQVLAQIANSAGRLLPGMYVKVLWNSGGKHSWLTLPQSAVTYNPYGATVFVLNAGAGASSPGAAGSASGSGPPTPSQESQSLVAHQVFVTTGPTRGDQVAILAGLQGGELVVTSGQLKLKNGTPVQLSRFPAPAGDPAPTPQEQ